MGQQGSGKHDERLRLDTEQDGLARWRMACPFSSDTLGHVQAPDWQSTAANQDQDRPPSPVRPPPRQDLLSPFC